MNPCRRRKGVIKALKVLKAWSSLNNHDYMKDFRERQRHARSMVNTRKRCSCSMCGNPRKVFNEPTQQEKRLFQDLDHVRGTPPAETD
jgi:hypothetical protein